MAKNLASSGHPDIPRSLLLDSPANKLFFPLDWAPIAF